VIKPFSLLAQLIGEFDDQYAVFGRQAHQHDQADLTVEIQGAPVK
jgi:hypothetical protein